jgi:hypothetical protein
MQVAQRPIAAGRKASLRGPRPAARAAVVTVRAGLDVVFVSAECAPWSKVRNGRSGRMRDETGSVQEPRFAGRPRVAWQPLHSQEATQGALGARCTEAAMDGPRRLAVWAMSWVACPLSWSSVATVS